MSDLPTCLIPVVRTTSDRIDPYPNSDEGVTKCDEASITNVRTDRHTNQYPLGNIMSESVTSIYAFSKSTGVPRSTVVDLVTKLGFNSSTGLGEDQQRQVLKELQSHPKLKAEYKQQIGGQQELDGTGNAPHSITAANGSYEITVSDVQPAGLMTFGDIEIYEPLELSVFDNSSARSELDRQLETKRLELEQQKAEYEALHLQKLAEDTRNRLAREKQVIQMIEMQAEADALRIKATREGLVARKK